jgi:Protein of unknown function (DUF1553)/Protein of unknown function (DUF1549)/Planctomycete cytochrome C
MTSKLHPALLLFLAFVARGEELPARAIQVLDAKCMQCHSSVAKMSDLDLSGRAAVLKGGKRGPSVVPGDAANSLLYQAVLRKGELAMPPGPPLAAAEVSLLKEWIDGGANWPEKQSEAEGKQPAWWAFRKPVRTKAPAALDDFILQKLSEKRLQRAPKASKAVLIRRLYFDLTGLPPTANDVKAFVQDPAPDAYSKLVDRLLASPRYGEKWGRHWLDLVRYSDTAGFELDSYIADAWRYRDWVIQAFNEDKPYDRFIKEQLAGDEIAPEDPVAQTGTGYFCVGPNRDLFPDQADINRVEVLTDYVDTTAGVFLGMTVGCARCHDHKFDPISQRDYYRLQAVFAPAVKTKVPLNRLASLGWDVQDNIREIKFREIGEQIGAIQQRCRSQVRETKLAALPRDVQTALRSKDDQRTPQQRELATQYGEHSKVTDDEIYACLSASEREKLTGIERKLVGMFATYRSKPFACGVTDVGDYSPKTYLPVKGSPKGEEVKPGFLTALGGGDIPEGSFERPTTGPIPLMPTTGRRKALAEWIASPENPLTARVMVNRIWQYYFGLGIVATPSDYGLRGKAPSHPELLDWLAIEFVEGGWSVKKVHRLILNSATYRQSSQASEAALKSDPENIWLSHFRRRRLDAEEVRDSVLVAAGALNLKMGGRPVVAPLSKEESFNMIGRPEDMWVLTDDVREHTRRSIYLLQKRTFRLPMMEVFDAPDSMLTCSRRDYSTSAPQSLTLFNSDFSLMHARGAAKGLVASESGDGGLVHRAWRQVFSRQPEPEESAEATNFLVRQTKLTGSREAAVTELMRGLFNVNEFLYID